MDLLRENIPGLVPKPVEPEICQQHTATLNRPHSPHKHGDVEDTISQQSLAQADASPSRADRTSHMAMPYTAEYFEMITESVRLLTFLILARKGLRREQKNDDNKDDDADVHHRDDIDHGEPDDITELLSTLQGVKLLLQHPELFPPTISPRAFFERLLVLLSHIVKARRLWKLFKDSVKELECWTRMDNLEQNHLIRALPHLPWRDSQISRRESHDDQAIRRASEQDTAVHVCTQLIGGTLIHLIATWQDDHDECTDGIELVTASPELLNSQRATDATIYGSNPRDASGVETVVRQYMPLLNGVNVNASPPENATIIALPRLVDCALVLAKVEEDESLHTPAIPGFQMLEVRTHMTAAAYLDKQPTAWSVEDI